MIIINRKVEIMLDKDIKLIIEMVDGGRKTIKKLLKYADKPLSEVIKERGMLQYIVYEQYKENDKYVEGCRF